MFKRNAFIVGYDNKNDKP